MKVKSPFTVNMEAEKQFFLEEMVRKYDLPDTGKAIRCLIDYARENPAQHQTIFGEPRCNDC
jgi:hypothetical protein